ncbi:hypothetical protein MIR68_003958 [Amoeboaphelidium protococcarum]|nr:hypothetical protein MIR68_003958 [Amoeboaphelidium protococcarum]
MDASMIGTFIKTHSVRDPPDKFSNINDMDPGLSSWPVHIQIALAELTQVEEMLISPAFGHMTQ